MTLGGGAHTATCPPAYTPIRHRRPQPSTCSESAIRTESVSAEAPADTVQCHGQRACVREYILARAQRKESGSSPQEHERNATPASGLRNVSTLEWPLGRASISPDVPDLISPVHCGHQLPHFLSSS